MISLAHITWFLAVEAPAQEFNPFEWTPGVAFWTLIIFAISLPLMIKFVFGPITKALAERDNKVERAAEAAEEARKRAEEAVAKAQEELEQSRAEARQRVQEAVERAGRQAQEEVKKARVEIERERQKASEDIEAEKRRALMEIRNEVVDLSIASAGRILKKDVDDDAHRQMVDEFLGATQES
ncbi:MAG: F0F1 ATP synthase subunit B [Planctomycetota bacterium]|jgi:F-type H+-transporting ATPase subunit b